MPRVPSLMGFSRAKSFPKSCYSAYCLHSHSFSTAQLGLNNFVHQPIRTTLTAEQLNDYNEKGYCFVRNMFNDDEMSILMDTVKEDSVASDNAMDMLDSNGLTSKCTLWLDQRNDTYSMFSCNASLVNLVYQIYESNKIESDPYIIHSKLMFKEPFKGGKWEWHQDFGYWYQCGCYNPHSMLSVLLSIDDSNIENGCLQVLEGSHKIGRIEHKASGEQAGVDSDYVPALLKNYEKKYVEMKCGDVLLFHSNLFHCSSENLSKNWRRYLITAFNSENNQPWEKFYPAMPPFKEINVVSDDAIVQCGAKTFAQSDETDRNFLDHETNLVFAKE